jgi:KDO2-lipid IV(A) lauroyltransferase
MASVLPAQRILQAALGSVCASLLYGLRVLSPQRAARITGGIAKTLGPYTRKHDLLLRNLAFGLPECDNPQDMARRVWENLGMVVGEFPHGKAFFNPETADSYLEIVGEEHFHYVASHGPVLFISGHFGNWELFAAVAARYGAPFRRFYRPSNNPFLETLIQRIRSQIPGGFVAKSTAREVVACLKAGENLGFLIDQKTRHGDDVMFLGHQTKFPSTPFELALRYNLPLMPARCERLGPAHHRITLYPPMVGNPDLQGRDRRVDLIQRAATLMESWIRETPQDWLWLHDRWLLGKQQRPPAVIMTSDRLKPGG